MSLLLSSMAVMPAPAQTGGLAGPSYEKLVPGIAGPQTNDSRAGGGGNAPGALPLPAIMINDLDGSNNSAGDDSSWSQFRPKGLVGSEPAAASRGGQHGKAIENKADPLSKAKRTGLMPLALQESQEEINQKLDALNESERTEMSELWEATLASSPDIQFVIERLMPTSNHTHATTILSRMLSTAVVGAMGALSMVAPRPGTTAITQSSSNIIGSLLSAQDRKNLRKAQISEAEIIMLYKMVRDTADKLVEDYRTYKRTVVLYQRALVDQADLEGMAADVRSRHGSPEQIEVDYIIRHQQNYVLGIRYDLRRYRQQIVDLAGGSAVEKLDGRIEDEYERTQFAMPPGATPWDGWGGKVAPGS